MKTNCALVFAVVIIAAMLACSLPVGSGWETPPPADTKAFTATEEATCAIRHGNFCAACHSHASANTDFPSHRDNEYCHDHGFGRQS